MYFISGPSLDPYNERTSTWGETEEDRLHQDPDRVRVDPVRDVDGRHTISALQIKQSDGGWRIAAQSQERCARHHP